MVRVCSCLGLALVLVVSVPAQAVLVSPDSVVASSLRTAGEEPENTINGSGLPVGFQPSDAHAAYTLGNHWTTDGGTVSDEFIVWSFDSPRELDAIYIWNHQSTRPLSIHTGYDVDLFDLTLLDASNAPLLTLDNVVLMTDTSVGQTFTFGGAISGVSSVRFDIESIQQPTGLSFTGLAEVAFNAVPEPSSVLTWGILGTALLCRRRG